MNYLVFTKYARVGFRRRPEKASGTYKQTS